MINDIDINKIVVSNKLSSGKQDFKCFIRGKDCDKARPLCIFRPQMIIYKKIFGWKYASLFFNQRKKMFIKYKKILENVRNIIKKKNVIVNLYVIKNI